MTVNRKTKLFVVGILLALALSIAPALACPPGAGTPGYWKNHPDAWPVGTITIGGVDYPKDVALGWMNQPVKGDKTITMFKALVAAKLNVAIGNPYECAQTPITRGDAWMADYGPVGSRVRADSEAWQCGEWIYELLDAYNNGVYCWTARD